MKMPENNEEVVKIEPLLAQTPVMEYSKQSRKELIGLCQSRGIKGCSGKTKSDIVGLINQLSISSPNNTQTTSQSTEMCELRQDVIHGDALQVLPTLNDNSAQIIIADPPYNIGKDFGNDSDKQPIEEYLQWSEKWISECLRILQPNGTMFVYGFSEFKHFFF
jgi:hypothetical protein